MRLRRRHLPEAEVLRRIGEVLLDADDRGQARPAAAKPQTEVAQMTTPPANSAPSNSPPPAASPFPNPAPAAQGSGMMTGATPVVPAGSFEGRWGGMR